MPCSHKFADDLYLNRIDFEPTTLIVGTFNPAWDNIGNTAQWFYGRTRNNYFWEILPLLYGETSLRQATPADWKAFCQRHQIALTDLIASIDDADINKTDHSSYLKSFRDDLITQHFSHFTWVDITSLLVQQPSIKQVYLTRSMNEPFWRQCWLPIKKHCQVQGIQTKTLLTPSGGARFQIPKGVKISLADFIFEQWQENWHF